MMSANERLSQAADLARVQAIIDMIRDDPGSLQSWPKAERQWFTQLLAPFAVEPQLKSMLAAEPRLPTTPPFFELVAAIQQKYAGNDEAIQREFTGIVALVRKLLATNEQLDPEDVERVDNIAHLLRRRWIRSRSFLQRPPSGLLG